MFSEEDVDRLVDITTGRRPPETLEEIRHRLSARAWQPITTAPKDGTRILMFWPYWSKEPVVGMWDGEWYSECQLSDGPGPTHWMPLPKTPEADV